MAVASSQHRLVAGRRRFLREVADGGVTIDHHRTAVGLGRAENDGEQGRLAGAIGPDQRDPFPEIDAQGDVFKEGARAEAFADFSQGKHKRATLAAPGLRRKLGFSVIAFEEDSPPSSLSGKVRPCAFFRLRWPTMSSSHILVVGAGFSGAVVARELAEQTDARILVIETRDHVAGNCHTERDPRSGIMVHRYGAHIFHTDREDVWNYVRRYSEFGPYVNRVKASTRRGVFPLPINLLTINHFFGKRFSPREAEDFIGALGDVTVLEPRNFEEQALKFVGRELYETFFYGYTKKQWGCEPCELSPSLLKRLPIRFTYDDSYFNDRFQGIPVDGYTAIIQRLLTHERIEVKLGTPWQAGMESDFAHVIFTGPIDQYYDYRFGRLGYRTVFWDRSYHQGDFQGNAVINYPDSDVPFTRILEHKHFAPWETHKETVVFTEYSKETGVDDIPFYPKRLAIDKELLEKYLQLARSQTKVSFLGRLATYRYLDMHQVVAEALDFSPRLAAHLRGNSPRFRRAFLKNFRKKD